VVVVDIVVVCPIVEDVVPPVVPVLPEVPVLPLGGFELGGFELGGFEYVEPEPLVEDPDGGTGVVCAPMVRPDVASVLPLVGVVCVPGEEEELGLLCARRLPESVIAAPIPRIVGTHRFMSPSLLFAAKEAPHRASGLQAQYRLIAVWVDVRVRRS